jgi:ribosomal protein L29
MHPLAEDMRSLKDTEIEKRLQDLSRKYFMAINPAIKHQISMFIDLYKAELADRRAKQWAEEYQKRNKDLDNLINVD